MIQETRGLHRKKVALKNLDIIKEWYEENKDNPDATMKDCENVTKLSAVTVRKHLRKIKGE